MIVIRQEGRGGWMYSSKAPANQPNDGFLVTQKRMSAIIVYPRHGGGRSDRHKPFARGRWAADYDCIMNVSRFV